MTRFIAAPIRTKTPPIENALLALVKGQLEGNPGQRPDAAIKAAGNDKLVASIVQRAVSPVGTTNGTGYAAELTQSLVGEYLTSLSPMSAAAQIMASGLQIQMGVAKELTLPARAGGPSTTVSWIGESDPIPVRSYELNSDCVLTPKKFGFIVTVSRELTKRGEAAVRQLIREDAAASLDGAYFSAAAADTETHAGLLGGLTALTGFAGGDREAAETDLAALADVVSPASSGNLIFVVSPKRAARLRIKAPDLNRELSFLPSLAIADGTIICLDPASLVHGFGDSFDLDASREAVLHMEDTTPLEIVSDTGPTTADPVRSVWQTDAIAIRFLTDIAFSQRRANAVAYLTGATW